MGLFADIPAEIMSCVSHTAHCSENVPFQAIWDHIALSSQSATRRSSFFCANSMVA